MACILHAISLTMALQHAGAPHSLAFGKWKRSHSGNALSKSKLDLSRNATGEEIDRKKSAFMVPT